jgi:SAM-dependent methyltransferase
VSSPAGLSPADTDAPAPIALQLQEPESLSVQPEFQNQGGERCHISDLLPFQDRSFVSAAYQMLLHRAPDADGLRHHLENLRRGASKIEILGDIRYSPEGRRAAVRIAGLAWPYGVQKACNLPLLGGLITLGVEFLNMPQLRRRHRVLENRVIELVEQTNSRNELDLRRIHGAMRELEGACNRLVVHAALKCDVDEARQFLQQAIDAKSDRSAFDETRALLRQALDAKAGREELTALTNYLVDLVHKRLSKMDLEPIERSVTMLTESVSALEQGKADRADLNAARQDAAAELELARDLLQRAVQSLSETKANRVDLETGQAQLQAEVNTRLSEAQAAVNAALEDFKCNIESLSTKKADRTDLEGALRDASAAVQAALDRAKQSIQSMADTKADRAAVETVQTRIGKDLEIARHQLLDALKASLDPLTHETHGLKRSLLDQQRRVSALLKEARKRLPKPISTKQIEAMVAEESHLLDSFYADFEDRFRGTRADIRQRQSVYLPYIRSAKAGTVRAPIIDLGCGRGEWLELLRDEGLTARGVDLNRVFLNGCRRTKLNVTEQDVIGFLRGLKADSVGAVTAFHLIEHLPHRAMLDLFDETLRVLRPGGMVIFETPNPENIVVGACTFYSDPTHLNPLPPEPTRFMLEARGFANSEIKRLHSDDSFKGNESMPPRIANLFAGARDYALIGRKAQR